MTDTIFTHDAATVSWDSVETDGITVDDDGTASFDWTEVPVVRLDEPPHAEAFDTNEFYKIEGATVARPIKQPYRVGDSIDWYKKPADELRKMAWSLDNAPFTLGHPDTGMVKDVGDIHGFWKEPRYDSDEDRLKEDLYIPTNDESATEFIAENQDVSIGFYNRIRGEYDGDTGDLTDDDVDGFQVQMYGDHVAGVKKGRCSDEQGCGLDSDDSHGHVVMSVDESTSFLTKKDQTEADAKLSEQTRRTTDCNCGDTTMSDNDNDTDGFDIPDLSMDALAEQHDAVRALREEKDALEETVTEVRDELSEHGIDLDEDECPCDAIHDLAEAKDDAEQRVDELSEELDDYREGERKEALDELSEYLDDVSEYEDEDLDAIQDELERVEALTDNLNVDVKNAETDSGSSGGSRQKQFGRGKAAKH